VGWWGGAFPLIDHADKALCFAKKAGRNRICTWDDVVQQGA